MYVFIYILVCVCLNIACQLKVVKSVCVQPTICQAAFAVHYVTPSLWLGLLCYLLATSLLLTGYNIRKVRRVTNAHSDQKHKRAHYIANSLHKSTGIILLLHILHNY